MSTTGRNPSPGIDQRLNKGTSDIHPETPFLQTTEDGNPGVGRVGQCVADNQKGPRQKLVNKTSVR